APCGSGGPRRLDPPYEDGRGGSAGEAQQGPADRAAFEQLQRLVDALQRQRFAQQGPQVQLAALDQPGVTGEITLGLVVAAPGAAQLLALVEQARAGRQRLAAPCVADHPGDAAAGPPRLQGLPHDRGPPAGLNRQVQTARTEPQDLLDGV